MLLYQHRVCDLKILFRSFAGEKYELHHEKKIRQFEITKRRQSYFYFARAHTQTSYTLQS